MVAIHAVVISVCANYQVANADPRPGLHVFDVVLDRQLLERIATLLRLNEDQQRALQQRFDEYERNVRLADDSANDRIQALGQAQIEELQKQRDRDVAAEPDPARKMQIILANRELTSMISEHAFAEMQKARQSACTEADSMLGTFLETMRNEFAIDEQVFSKVLPLVRRSNVLGRRDDERYEDFSQPLDLFDIVDNAAKESAELEWIHLGVSGSLGLLLTSEVSDEQFEPQVRSGRAALREILSEYESMMDPALTAYLDEQRRPPRPGEPLSIGSEDPGWEAYMREQGRRWARRHDPLWNGARRIELMLAEKWTQQSADAWRDRVNRLVAPMLTSPRWPATMRTWLTGRKDVPVEQLELARQALGEYDAARRTVETDAIESAIRAKRARFVVDFQQTSPEDIDYAKKKLAIHRLNVATYQRLKPLLSPEGADTLDTKLFGPSHGQYDPMTFGPTIDLPALAYLGAEDELRGAWRSHQSPLHGEIR